MNKKILTLLVCILFSTFLFSQERTYTTVFDSLYSNIRFDTLSPGVLYNRVFPWSNLERYSNILDTTDAKHLRDSYRELQKSVINKDTEIFSLQYDYLDFYNNDDTSVYIPISIINTNFSIIDTNAFLSGKLYKIEEMVFVDDNIQGDIFKTKRLFLSSPLQIYFRTGNTLNFTINSFLCFQNTNNDTLVKLLIDYDNGEGYKEYQITANEFNFNEQVIYPNYGDKIIKTKGITSEGDTLISFAKIIVHAKSTEIEDKKDYYIISDITYKGYGETDSRKGRAQMRIYFSDETKESHKINRPILIVDGFDPGDKRQFEKDIVDNPADDHGGIWGLLKYDSVRADNTTKKIHIGEELLKKGYDIIVLNFPNIPKPELGAHPSQFKPNNLSYDGGADFIERNALVCVKAIDTVNYMLKENDSKEQLVIIGPSMGGQITRFALKYMEDSLPSRDYRGHNTRLWASFDSPHQGANIALGAQAFIKVWSEDRFESQLKSPAAREMLLFHRDVYQYKQKPDFHNYYNKINQMGFPSNLRKVAITNGSLNGTKTGKASQKVLKVETLTFFNWSAINLGTVYMSPSYPTSSEKVFTISWLFSDDISQNTSSNQSNCNYDIAPGGTFNTFEVVYKGVKENDADGGVAKRTLYKSEHCFMPTKSTLAYIGDNVNLCEDLFQDWNRDLVAEKVIPFDNYIGPIDANMKHVTFNQWIHAWVNKELDNYIVGERELSLCGGYEYTINNLSASDTIQWECSENLQILSDPRNHTLSVRALQLGNGWIRAINSPDYRQDTLAYYQIYVGSAEFISETETTANTVWNTDLNIGSDYTIKTGHTLTIQNTDISFAPDIKIKVEPGAKLIIDNSTLTSYCSGQYWGGIEVQGQSHLPQTDVYQGYLEIKNSSIIQNAKNAITTWRSGDWNSMGGIVKVNNTEFLNNIKSIEFLSYQNTNQNNQEIENISSISKSNFIWDRNMYPHNKTSLSHVSLWDVNGVRFNGCVFSSSIINLEVVKVGIYAEESGFKVQEAISFPSGSKLKGEFNNLSYGIRMENSNKPITIQNIIFKDDFCGVFGIACNNAQIINNDFEVLSVFNFRGEYPFETSYGVAIDNSTGYKIENNYFIGIKGAINTGLQIKNSGRGANTIKNNNFDSLYYSTVAIGANRGINRLGEMVGLKYMCNDFTNNQKGIVVKRDTNMAQRWYGISLHQDGGDLSISAGNLFERNEDECSDICIEDESNVYTYVYSLENSSQEPLSISENVTKIKATQNIDCSFNNDLLDDTELDALYLDIENQYLTALYNYNSLLDGGSTDDLLNHLVESWQEDVWTMRQLYLSKSPYLSSDFLIGLALAEKLPLPIYLEIALSNPEATQTDDYIDFMDNPIAINLLTESGIDLIKSSWDSKTFRYSIESDISSKLTSLEEISRIKIYRIISDTSGFNISKYRNEVSKIRNIDAKYELVESYIQSSEFNAAKSFLNTLLEDPSNVKYYGQDIYDYLLLIDILEMRDTVSRQIDINNVLLLDLSDSDSRAGAKARAYLNSRNDNINYHPEFIGELTNKSKRISTRANLRDFYTADITLSPNPAKNHISITYNLPPKQTYSLKIFDMKGNELILTTLKGNKGVQTIDISKLSSGSYYYNVTSNNKLIKSDKIIIMD